MPTDARLGMLRLGASRLGYPILQGAVVPLYALLGVARLGATRLNYHSTDVFISIGGIQYAHTRADLATGVLADSLTIQDTLNDAPNTATLTTNGFYPTEGQEVIITLGSTNNLQREFAGTILRRDQIYVGDTPAHYQHPLNLIDYAWGLSARRVRTRFQSTTVGTILASLVSTYAPGYALAVDADVASLTITEITFGDEDELPSVLSRVMKRVGGSWYCDYHKVIRAFLVDTSQTAPEQLNAVHRSLADLSFSRDLSQIVTRVRVEGGGTNALEYLAVGETILPVQDAVWYRALGGIVVSGPQRITYTSVELGGGGGLVGPGASPSAAPAVQLATGAGMESGPHDYAIVFVTAAGKSIAGPRVTIAVGTIAPPSTAPVAGVASIGSGVDAGSHDYATTLVSASGETIAGPPVTRATGLTAAPGTAPLPGTPTAGGLVDAGNHEYQIGFKTALGETTPSPISGSVTTVNTAAVYVEAPSSATTNTEDGSGTGHQFWNLGDSIACCVTFVNAAGETTPGPMSNAVVATQAFFVGSSYQHLMFAAYVPVSGDPTVTGRRVYVYANGVSLGYLAMGAAGDGPAGLSQFLTAGSPPGANTAIAHAADLRQTVPLTNLPIGPAETTSRPLYRRFNGTGTFKLVADLAPTGTTYTDGASNASLTTNAPSTNTATKNQIPLTLTPPTSPLVTGVNLYGTAAGGGPLKFIVSLAPSTTSYLVTMPDASLGATAPTSNTATANQVALPSVPIGPPAVIAREIYRTPIGSTQLKLQQTIADNTSTTGVTDATADASLGANVPTSDASGLAQPAGNVLAGSTTLIVAGTGAFNAAGGWAIIGNGTQVIRYTGITGSSLTGIPATGIGAIVATIGYNSTVTAAPCLRGIPPAGQAGSILFPILKGDPVNLQMQVDDVAAQAALAALIGGDGIIEDALSDNRLSATECLARGRAHLALRRTVEVSLRFRTRDLNTRAGTTINVNLGPPTNLQGDFLIQRVTESQFQIPGLNPTFDVEASNDRFSFEDLLRVARKAGD